MILIGYKSALEFWLNGTNRADLKQPLKHESLSYHFVSTSSNNDKDFLSTFSPPIQLYVSSRGQRKNSTRFSKLALPSNLPKNSFVQIKKSIFIASPEFIFVQAARHYPLSQLVELGNHLCASYVFDNTNEIKQRKRIPITSIEKLGKYLMKAEGCYGKKMAVIALRSVQDNCGSPMESKLAAIFFLPLCRGGYGLPRGICNGEIKLTNDARKYYRFQSCRGDIVWQKEKLIFEYDSTLSHANDAQLQLDAKRQTVMNQSGYKVVRFTRITLSSFSEFDRAVRLLRKDLKIKLRESDLKKNSHIREKVFHEIFYEQHTFFHV